MDKEEKTENTPPVVTVYGAGIKSGVPIYDPRKDNLMDSKPPQVITPALFDEMWPDISKAASRFIFKKTAFEVTEWHDNEYFVVSPIIRDYVLDGD